jgi:hypothetical protein
MRRFVVTAVLMMCAIISFAQIGIGTTSPNTTLDVRGSLAMNSRSFSTTSETVLSTDYTLLFTGTSACTLTLPDATAWPGRIINVKNTKTGTVPVLTIATTASQTIDGAATWLLDDPNETINLVSDASNWKIIGQGLPAGSGTSWSQGGNTVGSIKKLGTIDSYDLPIITANTERMRITTGGNVGIGTSTFTGANPERLIVDAGTNGSGAFQNVIVGKGNTNSYAQLNIQNTYSGAGNSASSDVVATSDNGTETVNYIDMGINSGTNTSTGIYGGGNTAYLYSTGNDFAFGNATASKNLLLFTGGTASANERMRITGTGNVGIANTSPSEKLDVTGNLKFSGALMPGGSAGAVGTFLVSTGTGSAPTWFDASGYAWLVGGNGVPSEKNFGTTTAFDVPIITSNTERMRINTSGSVGIGTSTFNGTNPERLIVDAGTNGSGAFQNVIVGKGNTNSYAQLNIQNTYSGAGNSASSDVVATSDNGTETVNYIDMGINSGTNTSTGIYGGANTAYLYSTGNDFAFGNATASKNLLLFTGGTGSSNERMRITGTGNVGINTTSPNSTLESNGSVAYPIISTSTNITLDATNYTVILSSGSTPTVTLPAAASTNARRIYVIVNQTGGARTISTYKNFSNSNAATIAATSSITIQSDGTNWYRIQ